VSVRILVGDARAVLATLHAESVHMVCTSPPYWGLRDYGLPPTVWGGEEKCIHAWGAETVKVSTPQTGLPFAGAHSPEAMITTLENRAFSASQGAFCAHCGAWRGALGLEPDPALYVAHLVEVFRAVRRVLRDDGTCWVNLGDSYSSIGWRPGGAIAVGSAGPYVRSDYVVRRGSPSSNWRTAPASMAGGSGKRGDSATTRATELGDDPYRLKVKDLIGLPWRVAFALQADGWYLRSEIIWAKPNPMPESVTDRPTKAHEQLFLLAKAERYFFDAEAIRERGEMQPQRRLTEQDRRVNGHAVDAWKEPRILRDEVAPDGDGRRNKRSVWTIPSAPFAEAHFATFPPALVEPCVKAGTSERGCCAKCGAPWRRAVTRVLVATRGQVHPNTRTDPMDSGSQHPWSGGVYGRYETDTTGWAPTCACAPTPVPCVVLDPFGGAGTTALVADRLGRDAILIELKPEYAAMAERRIREEAPLLAAVASTTAGRSPSRWACGRRTR
jgi:DNA modification methylase